MVISDLSVEQFECIQDDFIILTGKFYLPICQHKQDQRAVEPPYISLIKDRKTIADPNVDSSSHECHTSLILEAQSRKIMLTPQIFNEQVGIMKRIYFPVLYL